MKKRYFLVILFVCITLIGCGKKGIDEGVVYDASTSSEKLESNSNDSSLNEESEASTSEDSKNIDAKGLHKIILDSIELAKETNKFKTSDKNSNENVDEYISDIVSYVNNVVNESLDVASIDSEKIDIEGMTSFIESVVKASLSNATKDDLISKNNSIPESEYTIDLLYDSVLSNNKDLVLRIILSDVVDINSRTTESTHVLSAALVFKNYEMASLLLSAGADPYELNSDGISFYDQAMSSDSEKLKKLFIYFSEE
ncbi:hypothetical protein [Oceanirhabdus sp. W0125-5]|uniref:hypothetical protein n=1 Tax=Oceanirhabdus sp. W0125-5 TaxID=2999116 RepID=UPI0022F2FEC6|nr:hypothetical protein [Oceanirhabdus sp. W0125-5]WBW97647.1 hypothetical protein OW730_02390 [Oceanirhabdus sp. W0125-5]